MSPAIDSGVRLTAILAENFSRMNRILVLGAGRSSSSLIRYLLQHAEEADWHVTIVDRSAPLVQSKTNGSERCEVKEMDALNPELRKPLIANSDLVISMLPARFHLEVMKDCIAMGKNMITPSYASKEIKALHDDAVNAGVTVLNEIGVDPGIDHMSALRVIDKVRAEGGTMKCFKSFTGGLIAPESDNNPWHYKFTWNPRNVVVAGQGGMAKFIRDGRYKYIPYHDLFRRTDMIEIEGHGMFEGYANRDSLSYREIYGLEDIPTIYRGTLRKPGFCKAWDAFVQLGVTDDSFEMKGSETMTNREFTNSFLAFNPQDSVELKLKHYLGLDHNSDVFRMLEWTGIFSTEVIGLKDATPAQILQHILEKKLSLDPDDKDMIVMWHQFIYELNGEEHEVHSSMVSIGEDQTYTAMSNTVGLPVGLAAKSVLSGAISQKGILLPTDPAIYNPILDDLEKEGIRFTEKEIS